MRFLAQWKFVLPSLIGKSQEGQKFKGRIGFWTLRPTGIGELGLKADKKVGVLRPTASLLSALRPLFFCPP